MCVNLFLRQIFKLQAVFPVTQLVDKCVTDNMLI